MHKRYSHIFNIFLAVFLVFTACAPPNQPVKVNTPTSKSLVKAPVQKPVLLDKAYEVKPPKPYKGTGFEKALGFKTQDYIDPSDSWFVTPTEYQFDATYNYATFEMPSSGSITGTSSRMVRPFVWVTELATHPVTKDTFARKLQVEMQASLYTYSKYENSLFFENEIKGIFYLVSEDGKTYTYDDERIYSLGVNTRYHNYEPIKTDPVSNPCQERIEASFYIQPTEPDPEPPFDLAVSVDPETHEFGFSFAINHAITGNKVSSKCLSGNIDSTIDLSFSGKGPIPMVASTPDSLTLEIPDTELELGQTANLQVSSNVSDRQWTLVVSPSALDSDSCSVSDKTYTGFGGTTSSPRERIWPSSSYPSYFTPNGTYNVDLTFTDALDLEYPPLQSATITVNNAFQLSKNRAQIRQGQEEVALGIQGPSCPGWSLEVNGCVITSGAAQNRVNWDGVCGDLEPGTHTVELKADGEIVDSVSIDILDPGTIPPSPTPTPEPSPSSTPTPEPSPSSTSNPPGGGSGGGGDPPSNPGNGGGNDNGNGPPDTPPGCGNQFRVQFGEGVPDTCSVPKPSESPLICSKDEFGAGAKDLLSQGTQILNVVDISSLQTFSTLQSNATLPQRYQTFNSNYNSATPRNAAKIARDGRNLAIDFKNSQVQDGRLIAGGILLAVAILEFNGAVKNTCELLTEDQRTKDAYRNFSSVLTLAQHVLDRLKETNCIDVSPETRTKIDEVLFGRNSNVSASTLGRVDYLTQLFKDYVQATLSNNATLATSAYNSFELARERTVTELGDDAVEIDRLCDDDKENCGNGESVIVFSDSRSLEKNASKIVYDSPKKIFNVKRLIARGENLRVIKKLIRLYAGNNDIFEDYFSKYSTDFEYEVIQNVRIPGRYNYAGIPEPVLFCSGDLIEFHWYEFEGYTENQGKLKSIGINLNNGDKFEIKGKCIEGKCKDWAPE